MPRRREGAPRETAQDRQDLDRKAIRAWLMMIQQKHHVSAREIASSSGVSNATIYRALDEAGAFVMSYSVASKIARQYGESVPGAPPVGNSLVALGVDLIECDEAEQALATEGNGLAPHHACWRVASEVLNLEGIRPGDLIEIDRAIQPEKGDVVVALVQSRESSKPEQMLRIFHPPYLLTRSTSDAIDPRPTYIDGDQVRVAGTFIRLVRRRAA